MKKFIKALTSLAVILIIILSLFIFSACNEKDRYIEKDTTFFVDSENSEVMGLPFKLFLDKTSNITLKKDGTITIHIKIKEGLSGLLNMALESQAGTTLFFGDVLGDMAEEYFPGFDCENMAESFEIIENSMGLKLLGADSNDSEFFAMITELMEYGQVPSNIDIPDGIGLEYNGSYYIKDIYSEYSGKYTGIYVGEHEKNSEPFLIMTMIKKEGSNNIINLNNEMVNLKIVAKEQ